MDNHHHGHQGHTHGHQGHGHRSGADPDPEAMAEIVDLDAEVLHGYLAEVTHWLRTLAADGPTVRRILDLGAGTGTGTVALLGRFDAAEATAVDASDRMLQRLRDKVRALGLSERVRTLEADLDAGWPDTGPLDLVWAANSLHHMARPDQVLARVRETLRPGGLLAVAELDSFPRFLPEDLGDGRPGLEERCHAALGQGLADDLPHLGSDWGARLAEAGFAVAAERHFSIALAPPLPAATGRYAQASLSRMRSGLDGRLPAQDLAALDALIDAGGPGGVLRRDDLTVRAERTVWVARRP